MARALAAWRRAALLGLAALLGWSAGCAGPQQACELRRVAADGSLELRVVRELRGGRIVGETRYVEEGGAPVGTTVYRYRVGQLTRIEDDSSASNHGIPELTELTWSGTDVQTVVRSDPDTGALRRRVAYTWANGRPATTVIAQPGGDVPKVSRTWAWQSLVHAEVTDVVTPADGTPYEVYQRVRFAETTRSWPELSLTWDLPGLVATEIRQSQDPDDPFNTDDSLLLRRALEGDGIVSETLFEAGSPRATVTWGPCAAGE